MAVATKKKPTEKVSVLSQLSNIEESGIQNNEQVKVPTVSEEDVEDGNDITVVGIRLHKSERNKIKAFFAAYGLTVSSGLRLALNYLEQQAEDGEIRITKAGVIQRKG